MDLQLRGKVALVFGASEGIGYGCARALAQEGARVAIAARRPREVAEAARRLGQETGAEVWSRAADVSRPDESARTIEEAVAHFASPSLDVLVNNGGGPPPGPPLSFDDDAWQRAFELLLLSNLRACRAAHPWLKRARGAVVNIVSTSVKQPIENLVMSTSLRSAVVGLAKTLSLEWAPDGIRVNNVCPGLIETRRVDEVVASQADRERIPLEEARRKRAATIPLGRFGSTDEIGRVVAFLASPAAGYVTGQTLSVDGGSTRWMHG